MAQAAQRGTAQVAEGDEGDQREAGDERVNDRLADVLVKGPNHREAEQSDAARGRPDQEVAPPPEPAHPAPVLADLGARRLTSDQWRQAELGRHGEDGDDGEHQCVHSVAVRAEHARQLHRHRELQADAAQLDRQAAGAAAKQPGAEADCHDGVLLGCERDNIRVEASALVKAAGWRGGTGRGLA